MKKLLLCTTAIVFLILVGAVSAETNCSETLEDSCYIDTNYTFNGTYNTISNITINTSWATIDCNGTTFRGDNHSYGLIVPANNTTITGCIIDNYQYNVHLWGWNITLTNSTLNHTSPLSVDRYGVYINQTNYTNITNNTITDLYFGVHAHSADGINIYNNTFNGTQVVGFRMYNSLYDNVIDNTFYGNITYGVCAGCDLTYGMYSTIERNLMYGTIDNFTYGIYGTDLYDTSILNNTMYNVETGVFDTSRNVTITNNWIYNNTNYGISSDCASQRSCIFTNNTLEYATIGIYLLTGGGGFNITDNTIRDNDQGILANAGTVYANISGNNISRCTGAGINWSATTTNTTTIYNNYFNNSPYVNANMTTWIWWNTSNYSSTNIIGGTRMAGNFWDDYDGLDITGDGIGDTEVPYTGNVSGGDYLPLQENYSSGLTLTVSPSTSVNLGTEVTVTCSASSGTLVLRNNQTIVANPYSSVLDEGVHTFNCTNFIGGEAGDSQEVDVTVSTTLVEGCRYNYTFAYKGELVVTANTTIIDMLSYRNQYIVRSDLRDVWVPSAIQWWTNASRYLIINVSGEIGNNLTVYFGNYLNNNTQNVSYSGGLAVTDTFENVTQINNFNLITHMDEVNLVEYNPTNASMVYDLYCTAGHMEFDLPNGTNDTRFLFSTFSRWNESIVTVYYSSNDFYKRHLMHDSTTEYRNMWLVDAQTYQIAEIVNDLDDLTGDWQTARLTVKKWIGDQIRIIDQQQFDASGFLFFYGIVGDRYIYEIYNGEETRVLGNVVVDLADLTKVITIGSITFTGEEYLKNFTFAFNYTNETGILTVRYYDPYNLTNNVNITVININGTQVYFADSTSNDVTFSYLVPNRTANYRVELRVDHDPDVGELLFTFFITPIPTLVLEGISEMMQTLIALGAVFLVNLSVTPKNAAFGAMLGAVMAFFFAVIGWLSVGFGVISLILLLSVFLLYSREVKKD
jgi:parallel beta-helix repeat protein